jgi:hypothetical protein
MERIGAKSAVLGTEARPSVVASIVRCLEASSARPTRRSRTEPAARRA